MQKPDANFLAQCLMCNAKILQYMDQTWLTLPVLQALVRELILAKTNRFYLIFNLISSFPQEVRDSLPIPELRKICQYDITVITKFPKAPYDLFLIYASQEEYAGYEEIPVQYRTEDLFLALFTRCPQNGTLPAEAFTDYIVDKAIEKNPKCIDYIPTKFLTHDRLTKAFNKKPDLNLSSEKNIPETCWDQALADLVTATGDNIYCIPDKYITRDMCIRAINFGQEIQFLPRRFRDEDMYVEYLAQSYRPINMDRGLPTSIFKPSLLLKLAKKDAEINKSCWGVKNYVASTSVPPPLWIKVLKICPYALKHLPKEDQTPEIVKTFFETAPVQLIDELYTFINLGRITKDLVPLLIGTKVKVFQDLITRKMTSKPRPRKDKEPEPEKVSKASSESVTVNMTDSDYLKFTKKYGQ